MPRLPPSLIRQASHHHPLLPLLLRECRDISSAQNELRWLTEHAVAAHGGKEARKNKTLAQISPNLRPKDVAWTTLHRIVLRRSRGEPLQYILGSQPFGDLEILCRKDVLIPRPETEAYSMKLAGLLVQILQDQDDSVAKEVVKEKLRILDLCSGTGCIALLLHSLLHKVAESHRVLLDVVAVDISNKAIRLGKENLGHNICKGYLPVSATDQISFVQSDVFTVGNEVAKRSAEKKTTQNWFKNKRNRGHVNHDTQGAYDGTLLQDLQNLKPSADPAASSEINFDVIIANPPYISPTQYAPGGTTARSVRLFEPKL